MSLSHITETKVQQVVALATALNNAFPRSPLGLDSRSKEDAAKASAYVASQQRRDLVAYYEGLSADERAELVALIWHGRGDVDPDWAFLLSQAKKERNGAEYVAQKASALPTYLQDGLAKLKAKSSA
ncbi:MAG: DUF3775 domain-containing protein [Mesorhizobium sp.]|uniref:DUF3775 domain-containing protein n=1 Tax=Mesorhizobium sp. M2A.F.Ca.ET.067.02.1.1 TaxID=2496749 RepID=UPI000FD30673|nr:DUF3775 domain-containing protein [Mesorhizobium sp. M2A.F.Ca.ET.067.02.1.1]RUW74758.1 DUF3775 domain-containing protein [Mesorhizobium sp. M2A.F.Ca.ET.067.02.1.1]TIU56684.1 MAG: DUF3775 domain-containing protein [Mesorhizobium sp.]TIV41622.1 MAG: DUF3775 domain-containing protein [Mesorhizobium sp.]TIW88872.1 MAG: DUF3775 domain-containing protein [Mesorhizobium sp.]